MACDGSDVFLPWFLWLLGAFILGLLLGWILRQIFGGGAAAASSDSKQGLTKIEGIGPKIEELLNKKGIHSYRQLSDTPIDVLEKIILDAGPNFATRRGMTGTWPAQAKLADQGEWDELGKWQDILKGGI